MQSAVTTIWAGESLTLFSERALYWERASTLVVADTHFGKAATFRASGIPVPSGTTAADLQRLDALLGRTKARRLLILGDFFHAAPGRAPEGPVVAALSEWRRRHSSLQITLVRGNHDLHAGDPPPEWSFEIIPDALAVSPFLFRHDPAEPSDTGNLEASTPEAGRPDLLKGATDSADPDLFVLCGHLHPAVRMRDTTGSTLRLPCFHLGRRTGLLPAFGSFTGSATIRPRPGDGVFVIASETEILDIPTHRAGR